MKETGINMFTASFWVVLGSVYPASRRDVMKLTCSPPQISRPVSNPPISEKYFLSTAIEQPTSIGQGYGSACVDLHVLYLSGVLCHAYLNNK